MISKALVKKPFFFIGAFVVGMLFYDLNRRGLLPTSRPRIEGTSCVSVLVMLDKRIPETWKTECHKNNLLITIKVVIEKSKFADEHNARMYMYRELANNFIFLAKNSLNESLERTEAVKIMLEAPFMQLYAVTEGKHVSKLATISNEKFIADHLQTTVKVKETLK